MLYGIVQVHLLLLLECWYLSKEMITRIKVYDENNVQIYFSNGDIKIIKKDEVKGLFEKNRMCFIVPK